MLKIRSRAIELAADPSCFQRPIAELHTPGEAKIEADAHLALCTDGLISFLSDSEKHKQDFYKKFHSAMKTRFGDKPNTRINIAGAGTEFVEAFTETHIDTDTINGFLEDAPQAANTEAACRQYLEICRRYQRAWAAQGHDYKLPSSITAYGNPPELLQTGLMTFVGEIYPFFEGMYRKGVSLDQRKGLLMNSGDKLRRVGSLSLAQLNRKLELKAPVVEGKGIDTNPSLKEIRRTPLYNSPEEAILRPHSGCLAMPDLPAGEFIKGGSGIGNLHVLTSSLIVVTNMHALDSTLPEHAVMPRLAELASPLEETA